MIRKTTRRGFLSNGWVVLLASVGIVAVLGLLLWSPWSNSGIEGTRLKFYCAAGISKPVNDMIKEYRDTYDVSVEPDFHGSGELLSKIRAVNGKGDLYLCADSDLMDQAVAENLVRETIPVAVIRPVLIVSKETQKNLTKKVASINDLLRTDLKVVLGQTEGTAVGRLTKAVLDRLGIWSKLEKRRTEADAMVSHQATVNKVANQVRIGKNYVGIVWDATAKQQPQLEIIDVPEFGDVQETIRVGILAKAKNPTAALQFARFLTARDKGMKAFAKHDFTPIPDADKWGVRPEIHFSAGAMLKPGIEKLLKKFEEREGVKITTSYNGCGVLVSQMKAMKKGEKSGRFPDAYFSCDISFLKDVQHWFQAGKIVSENDIVMVTPPGNPDNIASLDDLAKLKGKKIGLAHPVNSALGKLTDDLLMNLNLKAPIEKSNRVVHTDAAHDLVNKMRVKALDVAIVYRSNVMSNPSNLDDMKIVDLNIPGAMAAQPFAIAKDSDHKYLMKRLLRAILDPATEERFKNIGFRWTPKEMEE